MWGLANPVLEERGPNYLQKIHQLLNAHSQEDANENLSDAANAWAEVSEKAQSPLLYKNMGMQVNDAHRPEHSQLEEEAFLAPFDHFSGEQPALTQQVSIEKKSHARKRSKKDVETQLQKSKSSRLAKSKTIKKAAATQLDVQSKCSGSQVSQRRGR